MVILLPLNNMKLMPQQVLGMTGFNPVNIVWLLAAAMVFFNRKKNEYKVQGVFFAPQVTIFFLAYIMAVLWAVLDFEKMHPPGGYKIAKGDLIVKDLFKAIQLLVAGWIVYKYKAIRGGKYIELAIQLLPVIMLGFAILFYIVDIPSASVTEDGEYATGRDAISANIGFHANGLGGLAVSIFAYLVVGLRKGASIGRLIGIAAALMLVVISFSRMSYVAVVVVYLLLSRRLPVKHNLLAIIMAFLVILAFLPQIISRVQYGMEGGNKNLNEVSAGRVEYIWIPALKTVQNNILLGQGLYGIWKGEKIKTKQGTIALPSHPHNAYLQILLDMGVVGFTFVTLLIGRLWRVSKLNLGFRYALISWLLMALTGNSFYPNPFNYLIWVMYGLALIEDQRAESSLA
ncbi:MULTISPECIES: O-antigen ligase family protein [Methylomonas]|uniref:O-antigen ligase-related domain-containing protein n=1 Tax=Methylomonas koyamae TaxID=702114 RepID=A0A177PDR2_9GAMM|nr:O-antigen ligase family protein [Methylomonas koyamae]OAI28331.1 hypothetical protein A1355_01220 [Methylomonas koyamae]